MYRLSRWAPYNSFSLSLTARRALPQRVHWRVATFAANLSENFCPKVDSRIVACPKPRRSCCSTHIDKQQQTSIVWTFSAYFRSINWVFISGLARKMSVSGQGAAGCPIPSKANDSSRTCNMAKFSRNKLLASQMNYLTLFFWPYKFWARFECYDRPQGLAPAITTRQTLHAMSACLLRSVSIRGN